MKRTISFLLVYFIISFSSMAFADLLFEEHVILEDFGNAWSVAAADFDGDGDMDFVASAKGAGQLAWFENDGEQNFTQHLLTENYPNARAVDVVDLESDGDVDIIGTSYDNNTVSWFENNGTGSFTEHIITDDLVGASFVLAKDHYNNSTFDIDGDGDIDFVATACGGNKILWYENDGNQNFTEHLLKENWNKANCAFVVDIDTDGDMDIIGAARFSTPDMMGEIIWFQNNGEEGFTEILLYDDWDSPSSIIAADIDFDGDIDLAGTSCGIVGDKVGWFENDGEQNFTVHLLRDNYNAARGIAIADIDNDDDVDFVAMAWYGGLASLFENDGNQNFTEHIFCEEAYELRKIFIVDLDDDNDLDMLGASQAFGNDIRWWENFGSEYVVPNFVAEPLTGNAPIAVTFTDMSHGQPDVNAWAWDFDNDGIFDSYEQHPTWIYEESGIYSVKLEAYNDSTSGVTIYEDYINAFAGESALLFNGEDSYGVCSAVSPLNLVDSFTIEAWVKPYGWGENTTMGFGRIVDKNSFSIYLINSNPAFNDHSVVVELRHANGIISRSNTPVNSITLDTWQHLAVTYDGESEIRMYINGIEQAVTNPILPSGNLEDNSDNDLIIGNSSNQTFTFDGGIDELRIWNIPCTLEMIQANKDYYLFGNEPNLISCWQMNLGIGDIILDIAGGNHGLLYDTNWMWGKELNPTSIDENSEIAIPEAIILYDNYPNPFNPQTTIGFELPNPNDVQLKIYDITGKLIRTLIDESLEAGFHKVLWDGKDNNEQDADSGMYIYKIETKDKVVNKAMIFLK